MFLSFCIDGVHSLILVLFIQFLSEEALALELAGYCYLACGENETAVDHFLLAHEKYHEWGAYGKCSSLYNFVQHRFAVSVPSNRVNEGDPISSRQVNGGNGSGKRFLM